MLQLAQFVSYLSTLLTKFKRLSALVLLVVLTSLLLLSWQYSWSESSIIMQGLYQNAFQQSEISNAPVALAGTANATMLVLCRNSDLDGILSSMKSVEDRFNKNYGYPWTFLNEEEFSDEFKSRVSEATDSAVQFGLVPREHWVQPDWIDESIAAENRMRLSLQSIPYGDSLPYRNMCRYNSGYFYRHPLVLPYRYYWRVEPDIAYHCDVNYDPFVYMQENDKVYGFTITFTEFEKTIPSLWTHTKDFVRNHPDYLPPNNAMDYLSNDKGETYNLCHFWSNFEIGDLDFWRSEPYQEYFEYLESKGGFYYERWGDAPVQSIAAALFADRNRLHFFNDIGYQHAPFEHCPSGPTHKENNCDCSKSTALTSVRKMCIDKFQELF